MSNGRLVSPSAVIVKPAPVRAYRPKSIVCTFCPDESSTPRGVEVPCATTRPAESFRCQGSAVVAVVTTVAVLGPSGRYATWLTRTRGPVSGTYTSGGTPPTSDTLSRQKCQGSALPPSWKATWPCAVPVLAVKVDE